jgi:hypothetical protein
MYCYLGPFYDRDGARRLHLASCICYEHGTALISLSVIRCFYSLCLGKLLNGLLDVFLKREVHLGERACNTDSERHF